MKYLEPYKYECHEGEPVLRSCPECNPAHEHLLNCNRLHLCFNCGKAWLLGKYLSGITEDEIEQFLLENKDKLDEPDNCQIVSISMSMQDAKDCWRQISEKRSELYELRNS